MRQERIAFENWLGIKPCGAAHDLAWAAWKARASLPAPQQATPEPDDAQRRFEAGCVVLEYLRDIGAPYRAVHHMLIALHGDPEAKSKATPEPVGEVLQFPPMPEGWPARFRCDSCDGNGEIGELVSTGHFQPPERQTCPDCGGRGWASEEHAFNADHMREFAEAYALLTRPAPGVPPTRDQLREVFLANGFTIKEGQTDLKPYVYAAADALLKLVSPSPGVPEEVHTSDDLPPAGKFVIAWVEGLKAPLRAMWVPDFHLPANEDADPDWAKYSEEHDAYFAPSGWYECNHCDETNWQIHERVLAWSHLPVIDRAALAAAQAKGGV